MAQTDQETAENKQTRKPYCSLKQLTVNYLQFTSYMNLWENETWNFFLLPQYVFSYNQHLMIDTQTTACEPGYAGCRIKDHGLWRSLEQINSL